MALPRLLLIDDDKTRIQQFETVFSFLEYRVSTVSSSEYISKLSGLDDIHAVFIGNGCEKQATLIKTILDYRSNLPVILLIEKGTSLQVSTAIQKMLTHTHEWPNIYPVLIETINKFQASNTSKNIANNRTNNKGLAGNSERIKHIRELIDQVAESNSTVLVLGESGTGKEVVAQSLHRASNRKNKPFVPVNCGAIPADLLESELFGHEKGAFTGALSAREGRFEMAGGGTLFLDEIGDMPMPMQVKLLRVLQERSFERVGSNKTIDCDVRIIAATHRNLENEIKDKKFREDLYYRLNVFPIELPSLKERAEDIPLLVSELLSRLEPAKAERVKFSGEALALMMQHPWPGNVRELSNFIERLIITKPNNTINAADLPEKFRSYEIPENIMIECVEQKKEIIEDITQEKRAVQLSTESVSTSSRLPEKGMDLKEYLNEMEIDLIQQALKECNGVVAHAAKLLSMRRTTLVEKLRKFDLS